MPLDLELIRATEFIKLNAAGQFDLTTSKRALARMARACRKRGIERAMLDLRGVQPGQKPIFSPHDLAELVDTFHQYGFTRNFRLALLYTSDPHGRARLFSFIGIIHGWLVRGFGKFEPAMLWLSEARPRELAAELGGRSIPIRARGLLRDTNANAAGTTESSKPQSILIQTKVRL